ncbi:restriction endonuclease subunit S [Cupriavidus sp. D39]|uniref:restriction endonuclease subunit S n=1 Tax=Cupriavidus sp. D39 TaxID=2997877 RepID=UPI002271429F|nr:restriction endonuclease subunit S [Cupriavidus sp. D39]MCY0857553.1 restriction endonuclease subunit S [Cupriavidus sp. D39]
MTSVRLPFEDVFADESGGNIKTPQSEYRPFGRFAVVDQGKSLIAGYVDDEARICGGGRAAIVFGDHTRCIKFVDFPFCMGADGVKVLRPKMDADLKYLYYFLRTLKLPDGGYDRHFKYLKRTEVVLPPLAEQHRIAAILDQADALRAKRREALVQLDSLTQAIFMGIFGDPATNPKNWKTGTVKDALESGELVEIQDGNHGERHPKVSDFVSNGIPFVMANCLVDGRLDINKAYKLDPSWCKRLRVGFAKSNDLLLSHKGTIGEVAIVPRSCAGAILSPQTTYYRTSDKLDVNYLAGLFRTRWFQSILEKEAKQSTRDYIGITRQQSLPMLFPPLNLQKLFAERVSRVVDLRNEFNAAVTELDALFASLQHRAFRGEL